MATQKESIAKKLEMIDYRWNEEKEPYTYLVRGIKPTYQVWADNVTYNEARKKGILLHFDTMASIEKWADGIEKELKDRRQKKLISILNSDYI